MSQKLNHEKLKKSLAPSRSIAGEAWFRQEQERKAEMKAKKVGRVAKASRKAVKARVATAVWASDDRPSVLIKKV